METAALRIGCKVNLTLRITGVRPNGWHELDTVFLPLAEPSDTLRLALRPGGGLALHCAEPGIDPENNTLTKAYRLFAEASGFRPGVEAVLEKGIPHGAGLGGGSADAAALLGWLNARAPEPLPLPELVGLAARIGADVPFCVVGNTYLAEGIGEILTPVKSNIKFDILLVKPPFSVSTPSVYKSLVLDENTTHPDIDKIKNALEDGNVSVIYENLGNMLEDVTLKMYGEVGKIKENLKNLGASAVLMSGSGPSVFAIFDDRQKLDGAYKIMKEKYKQTYLTSTINNV